MIHVVPASMALKNLKFANKSIVAIEMAKPIEIGFRLINRINAGGTSTTSCQTARTIFQLSARIFSTNFINAKLLQLVKICL
jgi:hypothetical protein